MKTFVFFIICMLSLLSDRISFARQPSSPGDSATHIMRNPRTAIIFSAVMPGLGQVYNRKYWKVPLVYGAGGAAFYSLHYFQTGYKQIMKFIDEDDDPLTFYFHGRNIEYRFLSNYRDHYHRFRDISFFSLAGIYLLNIIDAMVDAEFSAFDVSDDLTMSIRPDVTGNHDAMVVVGMKLSIGF